MLINVSILSTTHFDNQHNTNSIHLFYQIMSNVSYNKCQIQRGFQLLQISNVKIERFLNLSKYGC